MSRGFSLIEIVIVIGLVGVLTACSVAFSMSSVSRTHALSERDLLVSLLTQTRAKAVANVQEKPHGVYIETDNYIVYEGTIYEEESLTNRIIPRNSHVTINGLKNIIFQQLTADVENTGTIEIVEDTQIYRIEINSAGRINW